MKQQHYRLHHVIAAQNWRLMEGQSWRQSPCLTVMTEGMAATADGNSVCSYIGLAVIPAMQVASCTNGFCEYAIAVTAIQRVCMLCSSNLGGCM